MSLQIWLPLNGSVANQGIADANLSVSGGSWSSISKIGTKGFTSGTITMDAATTDSIYNNEEISFAFWVYVNAATNTYYADTFIGNGGMAGTNNRKFTCYFYDTVNRIHLSWQNDTVEGVTGATFTGTGALEYLPSYQWTHVAITYKNPSGKIYINGVQKTTFEGVSNSAGFAHSTPIVNASSNHVINDFRIYDHALSLKEVKELAKGLVVHYALDNNGGYANLLGADSNQSITNANWPTYRYIPQPYLVQGEQYTFTMCVTPGEGVTEFNPHLSLGYCGIGSMPVKGAGKQIISRTFNANYIYNGNSMDPSVNADYGKFCVYRYPDKLSSNTTIHWAVLTKGATPADAWIPSYGDTQSNIEYDCSGHGYDATKSGDFIYSTDSARNSCSTEFNNKNTYIATPLKDVMANLFTDKCTINFWVNEANTSSRSIYLGGYDGKGFNIEENGGKFRVYWNGSPNRQVAAVTANTWQM